jgi:hypothetical protein
MPPAATHPVALNPENPAQPTKTTKLKMLMCTRLARGAGFVTFSRPVRAGEPRPCSPTAHAYFADSHPRGRSPRVVSKPAIFSH